MNEKEYLDTIERLQNKVRRLEYEKEDIKEQLKEVSSKKDHAEFIIKTELEPRITFEKRCYDAFVSQDRSAEACEGLIDLIDQLLTAVEDDPQFYDWENENGDVYEKILWVIKKEKGII